MLAQFALKLQEIKDDNFVIIEGQRVRKRRCNIAHLSPIGENAAEAKAHKGHHAKAHAAKHTEKKKNKEDKKN